MFGKTDIHGRMTRWLNLMAEYEFEMRHLAREKNITTDYLSRSIKSPLSLKASLDLTIDLWLHGKSSKPNVEVVASI